MPEVSGAAEPEEGGGDDAGWFAPAGGSVDSWRRPGEVIE